MRPKTRESTMCSIQLNPVNELSNFLSGHLRLKLHQGSAHPTPKGASHGGRCFGGMGCLIRSFPSASIGNLLGHNAPHMDSGHDPPGPFYVCRHAPSCLAFSRRVHTGHPPEF